MLVDLLILVFDKVEGSWGKVYGSGKLTHFFAEKAKFPMCNRVPADADITFKKRKFSSNLNYRLCKFCLSLSHYYEIVETKIMVQMPKILNDYYCEKCDKIYGIYRKIGAKEKKVTCPIHTKTKLKMIELNAKCS